MFINIHMLFVLAHRRRQRSNNVSKRMASSGQVSIGVVVLERLCVVSRTTGSHFFPFFGREIPLRAPGTLVVSRVFERW